MGYYTDEQLKDFPAVAELEPADRQQVLEDAGQVEGRVAQQPGVSDADLRSWAAEQGLETDRFNRALALLDQTGRVAQLPDLQLPPTPVALPPPPLGVVPPDVVATLTLDQLQQLARDRNIEGRSSMNRPDLEAALFNAPQVPGPEPDAPAAAP